MKHSKIIKHSFIMSILALLMCISMFTGSTFAWFIENVTSASNIIQVGTLDASMEWKEGTVSPVEDNDDWEDASTGAIFEYNQWEPGYAQIRHIKIENKGNLAFKYILKIISDYSVTDLAEVIDVYCMKPAIQATRDTLIESENSKIDTLKNVLESSLKDNGIVSGTLEPGEKTIATIALKMHDVVENDYQNMSIGTGFRIQLNATQILNETFDTQENSSNAKESESLSMETVVP